MNKVAPQGVPPIVGYTGRQPRSQDFFPFLANLKKGKSPGNEVDWEGPRERGAFFKLTVY